MIGRTWNCSTGNQFPARHIQGVSMMENTQQRQPLLISSGDRSHGDGQKSAFETWGQFLGGMFLIAAGVRQSTFTGGIIASIGSCLAYRGADCIMHCFAPATKSCMRSERPDAGLLDNPVDEASWESFPASDSPVFSGITK
jgi:hypothetical protein